MILGISNDKSGLPPRYLEPWRAPFDNRVQELLKPGMRILDVGSGRRPSIGLDHRPSNFHYVGLDISQDEISKANPGVYDEVQVGNVADFVPKLENRFNLIVSWNIVEHVRPLDQSLGHLRTYLRPGGVMVAHFSGTFSIFGIINQIVPHRIGVWAMQKLLGREPATVFPAHYRRCWFSALEQMLDSWSRYDIRPRFIGAGHFRFSRILKRAYLVYENWVYENKRYNLAAYYLVTAHP